MGISAEFAVKYGRKHGRHSLSPMSGKLLNMDRPKYGNDWYGNGGYPRADAFAKQCLQTYAEIATHCHSP